VYEKYVVFYHYGAVSQLLYYFFIGLGFVKLPSPGGFTILMKKKFAILS
jgi:hypothetical protein